MTITVSISQFRQNISDYLTRVQAGNTVILKDEKKGEEIAQVVGKKKFNPEAFNRVLTAMAGKVSIKDHPEWATAKRINQWLHKTRKVNERHF